MNDATRLLGITWVSTAVLGSAAELLTGLADDPAQAGALPGAEGRGGGRVGGVQDELPGGRVVIGDPGGRGEMGNYVSWW
jgi:hypothetical protein